MSGSHAEKFFPSKKEQDRLRSLKSYQILNTCAEKEFDDLVHLATLSTGVPVALFFLFDSDRTWVKARMGLDIECLNLDFFSKVVGEADNLFEIHEPFQINISSNALLNSHYRQCQFFAGVPVINNEGHTLGMLGLFDFDSRKLSEQHKKSAQIIAHQLEVLLEARKQKLQTKKINEETKGYLDLIIDAIPVPLFVKDKEHRFVTVNNAFCTTIKKERHEILGKGTDDFLPLTEADRLHEREEKLLEKDSTEISEEVLISNSEDAKTYIAKLTTFKSGPENAFVLGCLFDITEQKQIEKALMQEQYLLESIMNYIPDIIYFKDKESRFIKVNQSMLVRMGVTRQDEIVGKTDHEFFLNEHADEAYIAEQKIIKSGIPLMNIEEKETWTDGKITWVSTSKMPLYDENKEIIGSFGISRDISSSKNAEIELLNSKNYLDHILQTVPMPIFVKDSDHRWVFLNEAWCQFSHADKNDFIGKSDYDLHPKEEADVFWERDEVVFRTGKETIHEEILTNSRGQVHTVITKKTKFTDQYGNAFIVGSMMDITNLKVTQNQLLDYQAYLNNIINSLVDPVFVKNKKLQLVLVNDAFCKQTGMTREEVLFKTDYDFCSREEADVFRKNDEKVFETRQAHVNEEIRTDKNGIQRTIVTKKTYFTNELGEEFIVVALTDITELKRIERELIRYQNYLNTTLNVVPEPFYVKDANLRYNLVNDEFCNLTGLSRDQLLNKTDYEIFPKENADIFHHYDNIAFLSNHTSINEEIVMDPIRGKRIFLTKKICFNNDFNEKYLVGLSAEITEQKKAEDALIAKEKYYRSLIQNSSDIFSVVDENGLFQYISPSFFEILGYSHEDVIGNLYLNLIHVEDCLKVSEVFKEILEKPGIPLMAEYRVMSAKGTCIDVEAVGTNWLDDEAIKGIVVNTRNITERKKAEAEVKDKSHVLNSILSNMPFSVFRTDKNGYFTELFGLLANQLGMIPSETVGTNIFDNYPRLFEPIQKALTEEFSYALDTYFLNNKEWFLETFFFKDKSGNDGIIGFTIDVTERKRSEQKLQKYAENLEKTNKELDQFAYVVSHDLKAPLRAIANLSQWIEEDLGPDIPTESLSNMKLLRGRVNRMQALINGILDYSRVSRTKVTNEAVDMGVFLKELVNVLDIPTSHPIIVETPMPVIKANRTRLEQIFTNLISNAFKYHDKPNGNICIGYEDVLDCHQFYVKDDGPGIAKEFHEKIFVIFQTLQARDKLESTGVGLAIVKKIIEEQGGIIWVESEEGKGASFIFTIPKKIKNNNNII